MKAFFQEKEKNQLILQNGNFHHCLVEALIHNLGAQMNKGNFKVKGVFNIHWFLSFEPQGNYHLYLNLTVRNLLRDNEEWKVTDLQKSSLCNPRNLSSKRS